MKSCYCLHISTAFSLVESMPQSLYAKHNKFLGLTSDATSPTALSW